MTLENIACPVAVMTWVVVLAGPTSSCDMPASIRTYKPAPHAKREAATPPPVRTSSHGTRQKAPARRSLSPNIGRKPGALSERPGWDSTPSPRHGRHAAAAEDVSLVSLVTIPGLLGSALASPQHSQHADSNPGRLGTPAHHGAAKQGQIHSPQGQRPQATSPAAATASAGPSHIAPAVANRSSPAGASLGIHHAKGGVAPSPPRFRRLPASSLAERPPWTSPLQHRGRAAVQPAQLSSQQSTGTRTMTGTSERQSTGTRTINRHSEHGAGNSTGAVTSSAAEAGGVPSHAANPSDSVSTPTQLTSLGRSASLASAASHADYLVDTHAHAHAQVLQRLQQAVEEYNSSSPNVLVPAAVELTHALRQAARHQGQPRQSVESLQLAGLKLSHAAEQKGDDPNVPSPWPEWVRGAWGSAHGTPKGAPPVVIPMAGMEEAESEAVVGMVVAAPVNPSHVVQQTAAASAQRAQHGAEHSMASLHGHDWSPAKQPSQAGRPRNALVRRALAEAKAAAARQALERPAQVKRRTQDKAQPTTKAAKPITSSSRASATPPRASIKPSRAAVSPPRAPGGAPAGPSRASAAANRAVASGPDPSSRAVGKKASAEARQALRPAASSTNGSKPDQKGHAAVKQSRGASKQQSVENRQVKPVGATHRQTLQPHSARLHGLQEHPQPASLHADIGQPSQPYAAAQQELRPVTTSQPMSAVPLTVQLADPQASRPEHGLNPHDKSGSETPDLTLGSDTQSHLSPHAEPSPARSMTSVAALRQSFEQRCSPSLGLVDSLKPRNRLPLRKVLSKAHVVDDDGSPQQAVLLWQQSLRGEGKDSAAEPHAEAQHAQHRHESQKLSLEGHSAEGTLLCKTKQFYGK